MADLEIIQKAFEAKNNKATIVASIQLAIVELTNCRNAVEEGNKETAETSLQRLAVLAESITEINKQFQEIVQTENEFAKFKKGNAELLKFLITEQTNAN